MSPMILNKHLEVWVMSVLLKDRILRARNRSVLLSSLSKDLELGNGNFNIWIRQKENKLNTFFSPFLNDAHKFEVANITKAVKKIACRKSGEL